MVPSLAASHSPAEINLWSLRQETCPITLNHQSKLPNPRYSTAGRARSNVHGGHCDGGRVEASGKNE